METACDDFRDVLAPAEYPRYLAQYDRSLSDERKRQIIDADWQAYQQWLKA